MRLEPRSAVGLMHAGELVDGRFEIEQRIADGGMGRVYRALDRQEGRTVAIKMMLGEQELDAERFVREAVVLAGIAHPGIVRYVAHGVFQGKPYLVMEWLEGHNSRWSSLFLSRPDSVRIQAAS